VAQITVSVVSHAQNALVNAFLGDLARHCPGVNVLVTLNIPEPATPLALAGLPFAVEVIENRERKGFGANHNAAFARCRTEFFCVANPDLRLSADPFPALLESLQRADIAGPLVRNPAGGIEDSARRYPTLCSLAAKLFRGSPGPEYPTDRGEQAVDWVAGMFMLFRAAAFRDIGGFDEAYFMYYEDIDLCRRLNRAGGRVVYNPAASVVHDARRGSRRDPRLAARHAASIVRFLLTR
jgi:N-acetylglucosaminyl-diphospho-decaprenol L-rhamnosyltransferase